MSHIRTLVLAGIAILLCARFSALPAQPASEPQRGVVLGLSLGMAYSALRNNPDAPAAKAVDLALAWRVGYQTSPRIALLLGGSSAVYGYTGDGRARKRGFETLMPMIEYRPNHRTRLLAGAGLQLDAPVIYDVRPKQDGETRYSAGLGGTLGASYALTTNKPVNVELETRWNGGWVHVPNGTLRGQAISLLMGVRR